MIMSQPSLGYARLTVVMQFAGLWAITLRLHFPFACSHTRLRLGRPLGNRYISCRHGRDDRGVILCGHRQRP